MTREDGENYVVTFAHSMIDCAPLWARLQREFICTPYQRLDFCRSWFETQGDGKATPCSVLVSDSGGAPLLFLPLMIEIKQGMRIASFIGESHTNFAVPLFQPGHVFTRAALSSILEKFAKAAEIDAFYFDKMPARWAGQPNPLLSLQHKPAADKAYWHRLRPDPETTFASMRSANHLKQLRSKRRKMEELGKIEFGEAVYQSERSDALKVFFSQKSRWCQDSGVPDVFN
ncbi:MAG: hypothetical protein V4691_07020, partial [Pseudomonadota bacterium]